MKFFCWFQPTVFVEYLHSAIWFILDLVGYGIYHKKKSVSCFSTRPNCLQRTSGQIPHQKQLFLHNLVFLHSGLNLEKNFVKFQNNMEKNKNNLHQIDSFHFTSFFLGYLKNLTYLVFFRFRPDLPCSQTVRTQDKFLTYISVHSLQCTLQIQR